MCKNPGLGPVDHKPSRSKTIHELKLHETTSVFVGNDFVVHETGASEVSKFVKVMRVEGGWIYGVGTDSAVFVPLAGEKTESTKSSTKESDNPYCGKRVVGNHKDVFEYDGLFECRDCKAKWGAGWRVLEKAPLICDRNLNDPNNTEPDKTVEAPEVDVPKPPPTTEYINKKSGNSTLGIVGNAVRRFFGGKD
jgi:hypothetical protein